MYSRATPFEKSDKIIGTHQKIDRAAFLALKKLRAENLPENKIHFPSISEILHFEGSNGPDGIKSKSPGKDEPWHFVEPYGDNSKMFNAIKNHLENLSTALSDGNFVRASFEAAWMAHAITDALTPAHQYPLEDKIIEISGKHPSERDKLHKKMFLPGETWRRRISNNWKYLGPKGEMSTHMLYEMCVAFLISSKAPRRFSKIANQEEISRVLLGDFMTLLDEKVKFVADQKYYERYQENGWTVRLANETFEVLLPEISSVVALSWLEGLRLAEIKLRAKKEKK